MVSLWPLFIVYYYLLLSVIEFLPVAKLRLSGINKWILYIERNLCMLSELDFELNKTLGALLTLDESRALLQWKYLADFCDTLVKRGWAWNLGLGLGQYPLCPTRLPTDGLPFIWLPLTARASSSSSFTFYTNCIPLSLIKLACPAYALSWLLMCYIFSN